MSTATAAQTETNRWGFPLVACYRCGGSGSYSFNQIDGSRCYGCRGTGKVVRRGKAAKAWQAFTEAHAAAQSKKWADVQAGEVVYADSMRPRKPFTVATIGPDKLNPGRVTVTFTDPLYGLGTKPEFTVRVAHPDPALLPDPAEYTRGL